jgi:hypothetical protein
MQLRTARLCLDCEEVHDSQQCPVCASETFTYITRWVPAPERRGGSRPTTSPQADVYRHLVSGNPPSKGQRLLKQGVLGLAAVGLFGWFWGRRQERDDRARGEQPAGE